jgi:hypothetical protein
MGGEGGGGYIPVTGTAGSPIPAFSIGSSSSINMPPFPFPFSGWVTRLRFFKVKLFGRTHFYDFTTIFIRRHNHVKSIEIAP